MYINYLPKELTNRKIPSILNDYQNLVDNNFEDGNLISSGSASNINNDFIFDLSQSKKSPSSDDGLTVPSCSSNSNSPIQNTKNLLLPLIPSIYIDSNKNNNNSSTNSSINNKFSNFSSSSISSSSNISSSSSSISGSRSISPHRPLINLFDHSIPPISLKSNIDNNLKLKSIDDSKLISINSPIPNSSTSVKSTKPSNNVNINTSKISKNHPYHKSINCHRDSKNNDSSSSSSSSNKDMKVNNDSMIYKSGIDSKYRKESYQFEQIPLFIACFHNNISILKNMIKVGADMNYQCKIKGWTPLMLACQQGNLEIVNLILELGNIDINIRNFLGNSSLMISCYNSRKEIIERLLEKKADSNICNNEGTSPLMVSSALGDLEIMSILIKNKSNVNIVDNRGYPALMYSQLYGTRPNSSNNTHDNGYDSVIDDECDNRKLAINILISAGSRTDHVSKDEYDSLRLSIKHGPLTFVDYLLETLPNASSLLRLDSQGWSTLKLALRYSTFPIILSVFKKIHSIIDQSPISLSLSPPPQQKQKHGNNIRVTIKNKENFLFESLLFLIQCLRDIDIFVRIFDYFYEAYQFQLDLSQIEILINNCRECSIKPIEDYLILHQNYFNEQNQQLQPKSSNNKLNDNNKQNTQHINSNSQTHNNIQNYPYNNHQQYILSSYNLNSTS